MTEQEHPDIIPLQQQVRQNLFDEWINLLNNYREYKTKLLLGAVDKRTRYYCMNSVNNLKLQLSHYLTEDEKKKALTDANVDKELDAQLIDLSNTLFNLKIIDASIEAPRNKFVLDW